MKGFTLTITWLSMAGLLFTGVVFADSIPATPVEEVICDENNENCSVCTDNGENGMICEACDDDSGACERPRVVAVSQVPVPISERDESGPQPIDTCHLDPDWTGYTCVAEACDMETWYCVSATFTCDEDKDNCGELELICDGERVDETCEWVESRKKPDNDDDDDPILPGDDPTDFSTDDGGSGGGGCFIGSVI